MIIHNPILTGSFTVNGTDVSSITSSAASLTSLNSYTASQNNRNGTYATTGSNTFAGIQTVNSNLVVTGSITAQTLVVQTITSSVDFVTGSTRFGSIAANTHQFTGSVSVSGSLSASGSFRVEAPTDVNAYIVSTGGDYDTNLYLGYGDVQTQTYIKRVAGNLVLGTTNTDRLTIGFNGAATFSNTLQINQSGSEVQQVINSNSTSNPSITQYRVNNSSGWEVGMANLANSYSYIFSYGSFGTGNAKLTLTSAGAATFSSSVTATRIYTGNSGISMSGYGSLSQTVSGQMTILGHNIIADQSATNTVTVINGGWYSSMIKLYYNEGITFHTSPTVYSANAVYPMGDTERMRISINGNVGIGTNSPQYTTQITSTSANAVTNILALHNGSNASGTGTGVRLLFKLANFESSAETRKYASIEAVSISSFNEDIDLIFRTKTSNTDPAERVRIASNGQTRFQSSVVLTNGQINSLGNDGTGQPIYLNFVGNGAVYAGSSYAVLYAGSDRRIKSDIEDANPTLNKILSLTPRTFKYKERPEFTNYGFIAQEVEEVMPELVKTAEGITMCNGEEIVNQKSIESYGLAWASILVKAIQELKAEIEILKNK